MALRCFQEVDLGKDVSGRLRCIPQDAIISDSLKKLLSLNLTVSCRARLEAIICNILKHNFQQGAALTT